MEKVSNKKIKNDFIKFQKEMSEILKKYSIEIYTYQCKTVEELKEKVRKIGEEYGVNLDIPEPKKRKTDN